MSPSALLSGSAQEDASNSSDGIDDGSDSSHSNSDSGSESEKDIEHLLSPKLSDHTPKYYTWGGELGIRLPEDFAISSQLSLGKALRICLHQSGTNARPIPALFGISPKHVKDVSARRYFNKAKVVCRFMMELIREDEAGRTLEATFLKEPSVRSLNALVDEAQKRILDAAPQTKKRKNRSRREALKVATACNWIAKIRRAKGMTKKTKRKSNNP